VDRDLRLKRRESSFLFHNYDTLIERSGWWYWLKLYLTDTWWISDHAADTGGGLSGRRDIHETSGGRERCFSGFAWHLMFEKLVAMERIMWSSTVGPLPLVRLSLEESDAESSLSAWLEGQRASPGIAGRQGLQCLET
jgi:hypothetical protein